MASLTEPGGLAKCLADLQARLPGAWSLATSSRWTPENPAAGQCGVTALVAQDLLGGAIAKTPFDGGWHFYNLLDGRRVDFTASQFSGPIGYFDLPSDRAEAAQDCTPEQYRALSAAVGRP